MSGLEKRRIGRRRGRGKGGKERVKNGREGEVERWRKKGEL